MRVFQFLVGGRRWALYLPFLVALYFARSNPEHFSFWWVAQVGIYFGVPYWLAYWLSDAFRDVEVRPFNSW